MVLLAPFLLSPVLFLSINSEVGEALRCSYCILLMAVYWLTEALPLPMTSMIPMVLLPMLGIMSTSNLYHDMLESVKTCHYRRGRHQLSQLHQLHVLRRSHNGHRGGTQWPSQQVSSSLLLADCCLIEISFRIALRILMLVGTSQARLMLGFMITTMFLSMWIVRKYLC